MHVVPQQGRPVRASALVALACALACTPALAEAGQSNSLRDRLFQQRRTTETQQPVRYETQSDMGFVLDQAGSRRLIRFEGSSEIWALTPQAGPRGDVFYKNDIGQTVLRQSRTGGMTLYTPGQPAGMPVAAAGRGEALRPQVVSYADLFRQVVRVGERVRRALGHPVSLHVDVEESSTAATLAADALTLAGEALAFTARAANTRSRAVSVRSVRVEQGNRPDVERRGNQILVTINPALGVAGRPSSARITRAIVQAA
ncbi:DUF4908 domain-containing protein [Brevundimonas sp. 2R-24]|uniref:DUF4908 domain-containing protein n=1 Tax=Peiella sedimenti TaxID=3061083 RepID=A0ABT8SLD4_9CAUL|nr:DUF4908 domain-containing protein [Caulobacteraceae bacterium XZ-24]